MTKLSLSAFFDKLAPIVQRVHAEGSHMYPSVRLAQNWLETGGRIHAWNNLGGIKVGSGKPNAYWRGKVVNKGTWEVYDGKTVNITAAFRAYDSLYDFYKDQDVLFNIPRYTRVRNAKSPEEQARMLQACGYATDPKYADKIISIIVAHDLKKYDDTEDDEAMLKEKFAPKEHKDLTPGQKAALDRLVKIKAVASNYKPNEIDLTTISIIDSAFKNSGFYDFAKNRK